LTDGRRHVSLYLGKRDIAALERRPRSMKRGRWINLQAAALAEWSDDDWTVLKAHLPPRPRRWVEKLSVALPADLAAVLDTKRGYIPLPDVLRAAILRAAGIHYRPVPMVRPWGSESPIDENLPREPDGSERAAAPPRRRWRDRPANPDEIDTFFDMLQDAGFDGDLCHLDITPSLLAHARSWLERHDEEPFALVLGVEDDGSGSLDAIGLPDADATAAALRLALDAAGQGYNATILRFEVPRDATAMFVHVVREPPVEDGGKARPRRVNPGAR